MNFSDKLQILRKNKGLTQEELADKLNVSRAAVAKWEAGQSYPDIANLIQLSEMMNVTVDYLVKDQSCSVEPSAGEQTALDDDTYVGGEQFAGEEAVWTLNYTGRVLDQRFSGNFLKAALRSADKKMPFRGPEFFQDGEYVYKTSVSGSMEWFQGFEEIFCNGEKVYECYYHGGICK